MLPFFLLIGLISHPEAFTSLATSVTCCGDVSGDDITVVDSDDDEEWKGHGATDHEYR